MRFKVSLKKDGKDFEEVVIANNKKDAIEVALKNNPEAEVLNSDWTFKIQKIQNFLLNFGMIKEATQITLIAGPGDKLKTNERIKPRREIHNPKNEDLSIAILKL